MKGLQCNRNRQLTDGINFIHENNARLVIASVVEHFTNQASTLANVFIHDCTRDNLKVEENAFILDKGMISLTNRLVPPLRSWHLTGWQLPELEEFSPFLADRREGNLWAV